MLTLKNGRPEDCSGRLYKEIRVYDMLDAAGVEYQRIDHEAVYTMGECEERETLLNAKICKNLFLCNRPKTHFYMLMIPGDKKLKMKELSKQLGLPHLSFADEKYMEEFLDITPGSVSIMGLMNDKDNRVELLVDEDVINSEYLGCHPCINTTSLRLKTKDVFEKILPIMRHDFKTVKL